MEDHASMVESYSKGRGSFRLRARWEIEKIKGGGYQVVVTEIPFQVQKSRLIEKIAELLIGEEAAASWPTCATNRRRTCASSWNRKLAQRRPGRC